MYKRFILLTTASILFTVGCSPAPEEVAEPVIVDNTQTEPQPVIESQPVVPVEPVDYSHVSYDITEKGYPGTYVKWGKTWIDDINRMMPLAVQRVASNPSCDSPEIADLSDNRSTPQQEAIFYIDCTNGQRFYISQNELNDTNEIVAESDVLIGEPTQYIKPCQDMVKAQLNYPSAFDENMGTKAYKGTSGNIVVEMPFTAKNALGNELPQAARCVFGTNDENEAVIMDR